MAENSVSTSQINSTSAGSKDKEAPTAEHLQVLSRCFGHKMFRPLQWKIINSIISHGRDNCAIMPSGYGKSLCYQYPSMYCGGITIVVSPLISLMEDQVMSLQMLDIPACLLGTAQTNKKKVIADILNGKYSLVYLTPEFCCGYFRTKLLKTLENKQRINLIAIDEAHCVSMWGHDFRFRYGQLGWLKELLPHIPILAVTATATRRVLNDIIKSLKLRYPIISSTGFDRPNLYFKVHLKGQSLISDLRKCMVEDNGKWSFLQSTIIYCINHKETDELAALLKTHNLHCAAYHAGLSIKKRKEIHKSFVTDKIKIIVATIAFGMGINKPDVRNIIHYGAPKAIESYYQQVGRAGHDGQPGVCTVFYNNSDFDVLRREEELMTKQQEANEQVVKDYLETKNCRRAFLLNHFEGNAHNANNVQKDCCDNCSKNLKENNPYNIKDGLYDFSDDAKVFLTAVDEMGGRFGIRNYILFLSDSKCSEDWWKAVAHIVEEKGLLGKMTNNYGYFTYFVTKEGYKFLNLVKKYPQTPHLLLRPPPEVFNLLKRKPTFMDAPPTQSKQLQMSVITGKNTKTAEIKNPEIFTETNTKYEENHGNKLAHMNLYQRMLNKRTDLASQFNCMPFMIASNEALLQMAKAKPFTNKQLRSCHLNGFTKTKLKRFGPYFLNIIRQFCSIECETTNGEQTIENILAKYPLPNTIFRAPAVATYSLFRSGLTVHEIAEQRGVISSTVISHLCDAIKFGYPIKMIDLNISDETKNYIINVIRNPPISGNISVMAPIKSFCPPEITCDQIKVVIAYLQVRNHLKKLNIPYQDFEDFVESELAMNDGCISKNNSSVSASEENIPNKRFKISSNKERSNFTVQSPSTLDFYKSLLDDNYFKDVDLNLLLNI